MCERVAATSARKAKVAALASMLAAAAPADIPVLVGWFSGSPRQRRTGIGWASLSRRPSPALTASLTVADVDAALTRAAGAAGAGADQLRRDVLARLLSRATAPEQDLLVALLGGDLRIGVQAGLVVDAVAHAAAVPPAAVRRALSLGGDLGAVASVAREGGEAGLALVGLRVGVALSPMLASSAPDLDAALDATGPAAVEWKLDGVRLQLHRDGDRVLAFTRSLDEIGARMPEVTATVAALPARQVVLDAEVLALRPDGRPQPFQVTAARVASAGAPAATAATAATALSLMLFDVLHVDGVDLVDEPAEVRRQWLERIAPATLLVPRRLVADPEDAGQREAARAFAADALARGHEGVVVKALSEPYAMGRRGSSWVKVKPRITLDLVVLAVEEGHGRRRGWLSNLHLGARDPDGRFGEPGGFVMLGKTFKGLTDAMLAWQTQHLGSLATGGVAGRVDVRPELVVEVAFDGVQDSPRYPAGVALRFARVVRHRPDKSADEADTIDTLLRLRDASR